MKSNLTQRAPLDNLHENTAVVLNYVRRSIKDPDLCNDIAQETVARYLCKLKEGQQLRNPRAWMYRIAHNLMIDEIRRLRPASLSVEAQEWIGDCKTEAPQKPPIWLFEGREVDRDELLFLLPEAFRRLPGEILRLLEARYRGGMSCSTIAECCGSNERAISQKLFRSRRFLRQLLVDEDVINQRKREKKC